MLAEIDVAESWDGDVCKFSTLRGLETDTTRGLEECVRWPRPIARLGAAFSPGVDAFTFGETLEVIRMDGVGLR